MPLKTIQFYGYLGVLPFILFTIAPWLSSDFSEIVAKLSLLLLRTHHSLPTQLMSQIRLLYRNAQDLWLRETCEPSGEGLIDLLKGL